MNAPTGLGGAPTRPSTMPTDPAERKKIPLASGLFDYFPDALLAVARVSYEGNQQHNPGQPLHWARGKSMDQDDTILRHFAERGGRDTDGQRHTAKAAWRMLALLQLEIEADEALAKLDCRPGQITEVPPESLEPRYTMHEGRIVEVPRDAPPVGEPREEFRFRKIWL